MSIRGPQTPPAAPAITEKAFQRQVLELAQLMGWRAYHPHLSKWSEPGFPDLTLVRGDRLVFAELKRDGRKPSPAQAEWMSLLGATPAEVYLWTPVDWPQIMRALER